MFKIQLLSNKYIVVIFVIIFSLINSQSVNSEDESMSLSKPANESRNNIIFWGIPGGLSRGLCPHGQVYKRNRCRILFMS